MSAPTDLWHISEGYEKYLREESVLVLLIFSFCLFVRGSKLSCTVSTGPGVWLVNGIVQYTAKFNRNNILINYNKLMTN